MKYKLTLFHYRNFRVSYSRSCGILIVEIHITRLRNVQTALYKTLRVNAREEGLDNTVMKEEVHFSMDTTDLVTNHYGNGNAWKCRYGEKNELAKLNRKDHKKH